MRVFKAGAKWSAARIPWQCSFFGAMIKIELELKFKRSMKR